MKLNSRSCAEYAAWCYGQGRSHVDALTRVSDGRAIGDRARHVRMGVEARLCAVVRRALGASVGGHAGLPDGSVFEGGNAMYGDDKGSPWSDGALADLVGQLVDSWLVGDVIKDDSEPGRVRERERFARESCEQIFPWANSNLIDSLVFEWRSFRRRALLLYRAAVSAYFQYLRVGSAGDAGKIPLPGVGSNVEGSSHVKSGSVGDAKPAAQMGEGEMSWGRDGGSAQVASEVMAEVERKETYGEKTSEPQHGNRETGTDFTQPFCRRDRHLAAAAFACQVRRRR